MSFDHHTAPFARNAVVFGFGGASVFLFALATLAIGATALRSHHRRAAESDEVDAERAYGAALPAMLAQPRTRVSSAAEILAAKLREHELRRVQDAERRAAESRRGASLLKSLSNGTLRSVF